MSSNNDEPSVLPRIRSRKNNVLRDQDRSGASPLHAQLSVFRPCFSPASLSPTTANVAALHLGCGLVTISYIAVRFLQRADPFLSLQRTRRSTHRTSPPPPPRFTRSNPPLNVNPNLSRSAPPVPAAGRTRRSAGSEVPPRLSEAPPRLSEQVFPSFRARRDDQYATSPGGRLLDR